MSGPSITTTAAHRGPRVGASKCRRTGAGNRKGSRLEKVKSPKGRNLAISDGYLTATQIWTRYIAEKDVEAIEPPLGEEAATFILNHIILATRDTRDPEETCEGE